MTIQPRFNTFTFSLSLLLALSTTTALGVTWHVNPDGTGDAPTIQAALDLTAPGDIVELACGVYLEHDIVMAPGVTLRSVTGLADCATIDAQRQGRVLACLNPSDPVTFEGLTFTRGYLEVTSSYGGGVWCRDATVVFTACDFVENYASYKGGGLYANQCEIDLTGCRFLRNEGEDGGGGGFYGYYCEGSIDHCLFESNRGIDGAGLYMRYSSPAITWCTFLNNDGWFFGGGAFCEVETSPAFEYCTFVGNEAYLGGGIMTAANSYPTADNCVIAYNFDGAGVHCFENGSYLDITCSLVFGNEGGGYSGAIDDQTGINGNLADNPYFCDLPLGDLTVASNSPCLPENNDCSLLMGAWGEGCEANTTGVETIPVAFRLLGNHPNPFNPGTVISYAAPHAARVTLRVFDVAGRLVRTLEAGVAHEAGRHAIRWDGRNDRGQAMPSGTYVYRLEAGSFNQARAMVLLK